MKRKIEIQLALSSSMIRDYKTLKGDQREKKAKMGERLRTEGEAAGGRGARGWQKRSLKCLGSEIFHSSDSDVAMKRIWVPKNSDKKKCRY